ncbi:MAG TPA: CotH kinase family protein [Prolixibacteraceae bacterium]|nr:CotH kinase family protein [Prolixibacteraceae bacterium]
MNRKMNLIGWLIVNFFFVFSGHLFAQNTLFSNEGTAHYLPAFEEPDSNWYAPGYNDAAWLSDTAVIGCGYGPEGYTVIDSRAKSLYVRFSFFVENPGSIEALNFMADYDDGYIAWLNGHEIARVNVDPDSEFPTWDATATRSHASEFIMGLTSPVLGVYLDSTLLKTCLADGENTMAVHVLNDTEGNDLMFIPNLIDMTGFSFNVWNILARHKRLERIDSVRLPLVCIETDEFGIAYDQSIWTTARMGICDNGEGKFNHTSDAFNGYDGFISIRQRGQSSRDFAKKSYRFELIDSLGSDTAVALLGMPAESDWILFGPYTDKSQIRNKMIYDLVAGMGQYAPRSRFVELVMNGQAEGLYMITEQIKRDKNRVDIARLDESDIAGYNVTGGYIFKFDKTDPNSKWRTNRREIVYPDDLPLEQKNYLKRLFTEYDSIVNTNDFLDPVKGFRKYISDTSLVDYLIANEFTKNADAYIYSTYMYKDRDDRDGRIKFGPVWDHDLSFGNTYFQFGNETEGWQFHINHASMKLRRLLEDPKLVELLQERWWMFRQNELSNERIFGYMDTLLDQVREAQERNYRIWPIIDQELFGPGYYVDSYENEIAYMRNWIAERLAWIDANINGIYYELNYLDRDIVANTGGDELLHVFPNPFTDHLTIRLCLEKECDVRVDFYNFNGQLHYSDVRKKLNGNVAFDFCSSDIASLKPGFCLVQIYCDNRLIKSVKLAKME